jgi:hypothetical protein
VFAPLAVPVEIRALDVGPRLQRAFRLSEGIGEHALRLERDLPFEVGRPVAVRLTLPDDDALRESALDLTAIVAQPRQLTFTSLPADARARLQRYVSERMPSP